MTPHCPPVAEGRATPAQTPVRSVPAPGLHTDDAQPHSASAFFGVRIDTAVDLRHAPTYQGLGRLERLAKTLGEQRSFLEGLLDPRLRMLIDLRTRVRPDAAPPIDVALLARTWGPHDEEVQRRGAALRERILLSLPPHLTASPIDDPDELTQWLAPLDFRAGVQAALLTRREMTAIPQRPDARVAYYFSVAPFSEPDGDWTGAYGQLSRSPVPLVVSVALLPVALPGSQRSLLERYATFYGRMAREDRLPGGLYQAGRLAPPDPFAVDAEPLFREYARRYAGRVFIMRIEVAAERVLAPEVVSSLAATIDHRSGGCEIRCARTEYERALARWNLEALDVCMFEGDPRIWARSDPPPPEMSSLCVIGDARDAACAFRLPIAVDGTIPGLRVSLGELDPAATAAPGPGGREGAGIPPELAPGATFAGFRIEQEVGRGGMGVIFRATESMPARTVALKVVAPSLAVDASFRERFLREVQMAAAIEHPNVVPVLRAGETDGLLFIVMRFIVGSDLARLIAEEGRLAPMRAAKIVDQIADALDAAHARSVVHRDVKPANVLLESQQQPGTRLPDRLRADQARRVDERPHRHGMVVGTVDYMPPEQVNGEQVDSRADVYALGCLLYEALTGRIPYPRDDQIARMYAHVFEPPPNVSDVVDTVSAQFDRIIARAMAKDPAERYQTAGELGRAALAAAEASPLAHETDESAARRGPSCID